MLADKIIKLRKKNGWSQEELADKMNISRQAVSKWESAQTLPDLDKILQLSSLFGVTTDYLLNDRIEDEEFTDKPLISKRLKSNIISAVMLAYFGMIPVTYLVWSILTKDWHITWITFILGGVFAPLVQSICTWVTYNKK